MSFLGLYCLCVVLGEGGQRGVGIVLQNSQLIAKIAAIEPNVEVITSS